MSNLRMSEKKITFWTVQDSLMNEISLASLSSEFVFYGQTITKLIFLVFELCANDQFI